MNDHVTNTSKQDPFLMLADSLQMGPSEAIEAQEARGQTELVNSSVLPARISWGSQEDFEKLGFVFGDLVEGDPLFRHVQLPEGWKKQGTEHAMHSTVVDTRGIEMVSVFYKAAFYDRRADMTLTNPGYRVAQKFIYGDEETFTLNPAFTDKEKGQLRAFAEQYLRDASERPDIYADRADRARQVFYAVERAL